MKRSHFKKSPGLLWLLAWLSLLSGCLALSPGERTLRQLLDEQVQADSLGVLGVESVAELKAIRPDDRHYRAKLAITYVVRKSPDAVADEVEKAAKQDPLAGLGQAMKLAALQLMVGRRKPGDTFDAIEAWEFVRTEQGWRPTRRLEDNRLEE